MGGSGRFRNLVSRFSAGRGLVWRVSGVVWELRSDGPACIRSSTAGRRRPRRRHVDGQVRCAVATRCARTHTHVHTYTRTHVSRQSYRMMRCCCCSTEPSVLSNPSASLPLAAAAVDDSDGPVTYNSTSPLGGARFSGKRSAGSSRVPPGPPPFAALAAAALTHRAEGEVWHISQTR